MADEMDRYREMAAKIYGVAYAEVTEEQRRAVKQGLWATSYGKTQKVLEKSILATEDTRALAKLGAAVREEFLDRCKTQGASKGLDALEHQVLHANPSDAQEMSGCPSPKDAPVKKTLLGWMQAQEDELFLKTLDEHMRAFNRSGTVTGRLSASQPNLSHGQGRGLPGIELADFPSLLKGLSWDELEHRALQGVDPGVLWKPEWLFPKVRSIALALVTQPTAVRNSEMGFDELKRAMPRRRRLWKKEK